MELRWTAFERLPLGLNELAGSFHGPYLGFNLFLTWFHTVFYCENGLLRVWTCQLVVFRGWSAARSACSLRTRARCRSTRTSGRCPTSWWLRRRPLWPSYYFTCSSTPWLGGRAPHSATRVLPSLVIFPNRCRSVPGLGVNLYSTQAHLSPSTASPIFIDFYWLQGVLGVVLLGFTWLNRACF